MTQTERERERKLRLEIKERKEKGEGRYVIRRGKVWKIREDTKEDSVEAVEGAAKQTGTRPKTRGNF